MRRICSLVLLLLAHFAACDTFEPPPEPEPAEPDVVIEDRSS